MSRTYRKVPQGHRAKTDMELVIARRPSDNDNRQRDHLKRVKCSRRSYIVKLPDGTERLWMRINRDNRTAGLRSSDHRRNRAVTRQLLRIDEDLPRTGKQRRYSDHYGIPSRWQGSAVYLGK